jgi:hypothetical protein
VLTVLDVAVETSEHFLQSNAVTSEGLPMAWIALGAIVIFLLWPQYVKWKQRQKLRQFEQEQRRKWEQHRRE